MNRIQSRFLYGLCAVSFVLAALLTWRFFLGKRVESEPVSSPRIISSGVHELQGLAPERSSESRSQVAGWTPVIRTQRIRDKGSWTKYFLKRKEGELPMVCEADGLWTLKDSSGQTITGYRLTATKAGDGMIAASAYSGRFNFASEAEAHAFKNGKWDLTYSRTWLISGGERVMVHPESLHTLRALISGDGQFIAMEGARIMSDGGIAQPSVYIYDVKSQRLCRAIASYDGAAFPLCWEGRTLYVYIDGGENESNAQVLSVEVND